MKILIANSIFHPNVIGGAEGATYLLARKLSEDGLAVDVLATTGKRSGPGHTLQERRLNGVDGTIYEAPSCGRYDLLFDDGEAPPPSLFIRGVHHFLGIHSRRWRKLAQLALRRSQPDVLHTHTIVGMTPAIWGAARAEGVPIVHTLHDYHLLCPRTTLLRTSGENCDHPPLPCSFLARCKLAATRHVRLVTAPSRFVLDRHLTAGGFPTARAEVVPNACWELPEQVRDRSHLDLVQGLFLGQIDSHKGIPILLGALTELLAGRVPDNFRFAFAGAGPLVDEVRAFCARHSDRCRYHGVVRGEEKEALLAASSFLVLPSLWHDNFPLVILEAFSNGLPVIGTRRGGIPEIIVDGSCGQVVEPEAGSLAEAMSVYAADGTTRLQHGATALERARRYTFARHVESFRTIYSELARETTRLDHSHSGGPASTT
jgi:glycosyltransferase involved in cell wall biosynthesis